MPAPAGPDLSDPRVSETLERVLAGAPFHDLDLRGSLLDPVRDLLHRLSTQLADAPPAVFVATMSGLALVLALLCWHIGYTFRVAWRAVRRQPAEPPLATPLEPADFDALERTLGAGDARLAIELAWQAVVRTLRPVDHGALTPRQWARETWPRLEPGARDDLELLLGLHEAACYAGRVPTTTSAAQAVAACRRLVGRTT
jgi:hypothetical protein